MADVNQTAGICLVFHEGGQCGGLPVKTWVRGCQRHHAKLGAPSVVLCKPSVGSTAIFCHPLDLPWPQHGADTPLRLSGAALQPRSSARGGRSCKAEHSASHLQVGSEGSQ